MEFGISEIEIWLNLCVSASNKLVKVWEEGSLGTNINHKGLQRTAHEYAGERRIYKDLISKNEE